MFSFFKKKKKDPAAAKPAASKDAKRAPSKDVKPAPSKDAKAPSPKDAKPAEKKSAPKSEQPTSLKEALAAMEETIPGATQDKPPAKVSAGVNLDKAKAALDKMAARGAVDRETLIKQALAIQQTQAKMLDKLPEATRNKLRDMALKAFVIDEPKTKDQKKKMN